MTIDVKKLFIDVITELSNEKPLGKVTVTDIVRHVSTGRQTFYNHFLDKNGLIFWISHRTLRGEKRIIETNSFYVYLLSIYERVKLNQPLLTQACHLGGQSCPLKFVHNQTYNYYRDYVSNRSGEHVLTDEYLYALVSNAHEVPNMYVKWACDSMVVPPEGMTRYAMNFVPDCIKAYLVSKGSEPKQFAPEIVQISLSPKDSFCCQKRCGGKWGWTTDTE